VLEDSESFKHKMGLCSGGAWSSTFAGSMRSLQILEILGVSSAWMNAVGDLTFHVDICMFAGKPQMRGSVECRLSVQSVYYCMCTFCLFSGNKRPVAKLKCRGCLI